MTRGLMLALLVEYKQTLEKATDGSARPIRDSSKPNLNHLYWMCDQVAVFISENRIEKAMRWLGFIQGAFWVLGVRTVEEMKKDNMPRGETYDKDRV